MTALHRGLAVRGFLSPGTAALTGLTPPVPDVRGLARDAAITALLRAGYRVALDPVTVAPDAALPPGQVAAQDPVPGDRVPYGSTVTLSLTDGSDVTVLIPDPSTITGIR